MMSRQGTESEIKIPRLGEIALLLSVIPILLPHLWRIPWQLSLFALILIAWRIVLTQRGLPHPRLFLRILLVIGGTGLVLGQYRSLFGQEAGTALLTLMLILKLLEIRSLRDAQIAVFISYFLVITAFLFQQSFMLGGYLFFAVLALTYTLILLNHPGVQRRHLRLHLRTGMRLMFHAMPLMLLLFILFPRLNAPLWSMPNLADSGVTGVTDELNMGSIASLAESDEVAFRVSFAEEVPAADQLYWRSMVLSVTDGRRWSRSAKVETLVDVERQETALQEPVVYEITLQPTHQVWIAMLDYPLQRPESLGNPITFTRYNGGQTESRYKLTKVIKYRGLSRLGGRGLEWSSRELMQALQIPEGVNPQTAELARRWRAETSSRDQLIDRALDHFRDQPFYYTRSPDKLGRNPVDQFLFQSQRGFCEHYAAAFVTLMRYAGVPARIVVGYQGGEENPVGGYLVVRQARAHAWAEAWSDREGWKRVDPTHVIPPERVEQSVDQQRFQSTSAPSLPAHQLAALIAGWRMFKNGWDSLNHQWNQWVIGFNQQRQRQLLQQLGFDQVNWWLLLQLLLGGVTLLIGVTTWLIVRKRERVDPVVQDYRILCRKMAACGGELRAGESPEEYCRRMIKRFPYRKDEINILFENYHQLRYRTHPPKGLAETFKKRVKAFTPNQVSKKSPVLKKEPGSA